MANISTEQGLSILFDVIKNDKRHLHYERVVQLASDYKTFSTGDDIERFLKKVAKREPDDLFEQRKEITQDIIKCVVKRMMDVFYKVPRSNYKQELTYPGNKAEDQRKAELTTIINKFWGSKSLDQYLSTRLLELNQVDPNSFVVLEFKPFDNTRERAKPYPFEVYAHEAIDFNYDEYILQYLIAMTDVDTKIKKETKSKVPASMGKKLQELFKTVTMKKYTMYLSEDTIVMTEIHKDKEPNIIFEKENISQTEKGSFVRLKKKVYRIDIFNHGAGTVPAFRSGYVADLLTNGLTCVSPYDAAVPLLKKTIKVNSELDLTMALQAFPIPIRYAEPCRQEGCHNGVLVNGDECTVCKGTGIKARPTSTAEEIVIKLPNDPNNLVDLSKLLSFKHPETSIVQFQSQYLDSLTVQAIQVVFNSDIFTKAEIADTATGKNISLQNVYDTLFPLSQHLTSVWEFTIDVVSTFTDLNEGLERKMHFRKDFKLKTLDDYLSELNQARSSGAGAAAVLSIQNDIMQFIHENNEPALLKWQIMQRFNPFAGLSKEEVSFALSSQLTTKRNKVLYINLSNIFEQIEKEQPAFFKFDHQKQMTTVNAAVDALINELPSNSIPSLI